MWSTLIQHANTTWVCWISVHWTPYFTTGVQCTLIQHQVIYWRVQWACIAYPTSLTGVNTLFQHTNVTWCVEWVCFIQWQCQRSNGAHLIRELIKWRLLIGLLRAGAQLMLLLWIITDKPVVISIFVEHIIVIYYSQGSTFIPTLSSAIEETLLLLSPRYTQTMWACKI